jgi:hypothetical protein
MKRPLLDEVTIGGKVRDMASLPEGYRVDADVGLVLHESISGQVVHTARWPERGLFETRATRTPGGDYLLMFPDGGHYGGKKEKVNDMLAYRSSDKGKTWKGPTVAFDIDYNQHGFVPFIPRGSNRIYAFGTQPVWGLWTQERGLGENTPIGYRFSDDAGQHWSEVRLIRPKNDPGFTGMSVMRMCETDAGTWLIGSHEGDWSYRPLMTRQYILRSEDRGSTWELLPHPRHGGWCVPEFNRMDEGRPINVGGGEIMMMIRTCEGHLWATWSRDDGRAWSKPEPTSLVHPDAPPMLFHLSDGKTLVAFHHNRHSVSRGAYTGLGSNPECFMDRSEIWFSLSSDRGHTWSEPRFVFANALAPSFENAFRNYQCSYMDAVVEDGVIHLFVPHRWERVLHLELREDALASLSAQDGLRG